MNNKVMLNEIWQCKHTREHQIYIVWPYLFFFYLKQRITKVNMCYNFLPFENKFVLQVSTIYTYIEPIWL